MFSVRFKNQFRERLSEWIAASMLLLWGLIMAFDPPSDQNAEYFTVLQNTFPYATWAIIGILFGFLRLVALGINGYWRPTAHLRAIGAILGTLVWGAIIVSYLILPWTPLAVAGALGMLFLDLTAVWYAAGDAKMADSIAYKEKLRNGASGRSRVLSS